MHYVHAKTLLSAQNGMNLYRGCCRASSKVMSEKVTSFALCLRSSL